MSDFRKRVEDVLYSKGMTRNTLADLIDMDAANMNKIINKGNPKLDTIVRIAKALGVTVAHLTATSTVADAGYTLPSSGSVPVVDNTADADRLLMSGHRFVILTR